MKVLAVVLIALAFIPIAVGTVAGFVWDHLAMGWVVGRNANHWLGRKADEIRGKA